MQVLFLSMKVLDLIVFGIVQSVMFDCPTGKRKKRKEKKTSTMCKCLIG
jgi:hypothetical protein